MSAKLTPAARTAIRTCPLRGSGAGRSSIRRTSGPPLAVVTRAFISTQSPRGPWTNHTLWATRSPLGGRPWPKLVRSRREAESLPTGREPPQATGPLRLPRRALTWQRYRARHGRRSFRHRRPLRPLGRGDGEEIEALGVTAEDT